MSASKKKQLFGGSDSDDDAATAAFAEAAEDSFKVNRAYASEYDKVKRKQELQKLSSKYGDVEDSDDTEEDDDARMLTAEAEADFAVLLKKLRSNDPSLKDKSVAFFRKQAGSDDDSEDDDDDERPTLPSGSKKAFTLKDEFQRGVVAAAAAEDEDEGPKGRRGRKAVTADEKSARAAFLAAAEGADESAAEFAIKDGTKGMADKAKKAKAAAAISDVDAEAAITEALGTTGTADDAFLGKFFAAGGWKMEKETEYTWEQEAADEQDEQFYDDAEQWEKEFQEKRFRHEEGDAAAQLQAFPRQQEGLLRQKDTARKDARERRAERQATEESRAVEDLKRLKNLKHDEIKAFQRKIAEVAGLGRREERNRKAKKAAKKAAKKGGGGDDDDEDLEKPNFDDEDDAEEARIAKLLSQAALEEEYDPETFDKQMSALFDDNYYQDVDDDELGVMAAEDDFAVGADANEESAYFLANKEEMADAAANDASDDDEKPDASALAKRAAAAKKALEKRSAINSELPEELRGVDDELLYPTMHFEKAMRDGGASSSAAAAAGGDATTEDAAELKRQLDKKVEEYWALHHSGVSGGLKTRFKYREVNPEKFGLDLEEIFTMDDRALNMIAPLAACATYNTRSQNTKDRYRALHRRKVLRMLPADRQSRRYKGTTVVFDPETIDSETGKKIARTVRRQVEGADGDIEKEINDADTEEAAKKAAVGAAKHTKNQARQGKRGDAPRDDKPQRQGQQQQQQQGNQQRRNPHHQQQQGQNRQEGGKRSFDKRPRQQGEGNQGGNNNARRPPRAESDTKATAATLDNL